MCMTNRSTNVPYVGNVLILTEIVRTKCSSIALIAAHGWTENGGKDDRS